MNISYGVLHMILSLPELPTYTSSKKTHLFVVNEQGGRGWAPDPPNPPSDGREPYQSTYFFVMEIALLSYLSIFCTSSVIFLSYTDYNLKQNYTHYNVNSKIRSFSTDLSFFSRKNFIPFCVAAKDCLKTICRISGKHFTDVI